MQPGARLVSVRIRDLVHAPARPDTLLPMGFPECSVRNGHVLLSPCQLLRPSESVRWFAPPSPTDTA